MRNLRKNLVLTVFLGIAIIIALSGSVHATPILTFGSNNTDANATTNSSEATKGVDSSASSATLNTADTNTNTATNTSNSTGSVTLSTTNSSANRVTVNNVDTNKDLPQTGENDVYIVTAVGTVALIIGGVAYMKARKYDI